MLNKTPTLTYTVTFLKLNFQQEGPCPHPFPSHPFTKSTMADALPLSKKHIVRFCSSLSRSVFRVSAERFEKPIVKSTC